MVGNFSASKKSAVFKCPSRCSLLVEMLAASAAEEFVTTRAFPGSAVTERQGANIKFRIMGASAATAGGGAQPLSSLFTSVEEVRAALGRGASVTLGQTSLETVFNTFASQQEEEVGVARGFTSVAK